MVAREMKVPFKKRVFARAKGKSLLLNRAHIKAHFIRAKIIGNNYRDGMAVRTLLLLLLPVVSAKGHLYIYIVVQL